MYKQRSFTLKPAEADKKWFLIDAEGHTVGRLATKIADVLRGKDQPTFTPHTDSGHFVVVINAEKVKFTGNKLDAKKYYWHTGYAGGIKEITAKKQLEQHPERVLMSAVKGMLPKTSLGRKQLTKLKVFAGSEHTHEAQKPEPLNIK
jgi:large subunit ribosomal protein L13